MNFSMTYHVRSLWDFMQRSLLAVSNSKLISGIWLMFASAFSAITTLGNSTEVAQPQDAKPDCAILDELEKYFKRFISLPDESLYSLVSLWVIGTHLHKEFNFFGYLFLHSPEAQSGKSRLLELLNEVAYSPSGIVVSPTPAILFRAADNNTFLLDEVDGWTNRDELKEVLNAGFQKGRNVVRCSGKDSNYTPRNFNVYAPRALAGIGTDILDAVTRDRTFMIRMVRQKQSERRERFQPTKIKLELDALRKGISDWVKRNRPAVCDWYENGDAVYLQNFYDRTIDISQPLATILEIAYRHSAENIKEIRARFTNAVAITRGEKQNSEDGHEILKELMKLAEAEDPLIGNASELAEKLHPVLDESLSDKEVSPVLRRYDFTSRSTRLRGEAQPRYRYSLSYAVLKDLCERYAVLETELQEQAVPPERVM